ncbi:MAG: hypothetical protein AABY22_09145 [Nanoarchaeota archaeon]
MNETYFEEGKYYKLLKAKTKLGSEITRVFTKNNLVLCSENSRNVVCFFDMIENKIYSLDKREFLLSTIYQYDKTYIFDSAKSYFRTEKICYLELSYKEELI